MHAVTPDDLPMLPTLPGDIPATINKPKGTASGQLHLFEAYKQVPLLVTESYANYLASGIFIATDMRPFECH